MKFSYYLWERRCPSEAVSHDKRNCLRDKVARIFKVLFKDSNLSKRLTVYSVEMSFSCTSLALFRPFLYVVNKRKMHESFIDNFNFTLFVVINILDMLFPALLGRLHFGFYHRSVEPLIWRRNWEELSYCTGPRSEDQESARSKRIHC